MSQTEPQTEPQPALGSDHSQDDTGAHTGYVDSVTFSPDGRSIASASWDKTIRIWDAQSMTPIGEPLRGHTAVVTSVAYSPLGNMVASGSWDFTIRLWDTSTNQPIGEPLEGHDGDVNSVTFSPGTDFIASGSSDRTVRLWDAKHRMPAADPFVGHSYVVYSVAFSPGGAQIVSGSADMTIHIWDVEYETTVVGPLKGHTQAVRSVIFAPDGSQIISGSEDRTLLLWDTRSGSVISESFEGHTSWVSSVSFSPSGVYIASGSNDRTVRVWDMRMRREVVEAFRQHTDTVYSVEFSPCGGRVVSGSYDETVKIWNMPDDLGTEGGSRSKTEDSVKSNEIVGMESIDQHMSAQDIFSLLLRHGCVDLSRKMSTKQDAAILMSGGGFGDIWKGKLHDGTKVAIKAWRASLMGQCDYKTLKRAAREIHFWSKMKHENVHELMGVIIFMDHSLGMISGWMENGNLHDYLRHDPSVNRLQLSIEVASGLAYMHNYNMIHGDLKAFNVLVSSDGIAKLTDFGLSTMSEVSLAFSATATSQAGSIRWAAPEILLEGAPKSKQSDIYALGMTILETFTGAVPYPQCLRDFQVLLAVQQGVLPTRPANLPGANEHMDPVWNLLLNCWDRKSNARLSAQQVVKLLTLVVP